MELQLSEMSGKWPDVKEVSRKIIYC